MLASAGGGERGRGSRNGEYVSTLKSVALLGSLLMVISYEAELSSLKPSGAQVNEQSR